jgi:hypothetical protein
MGLGHFPAQIGLVKTADFIPDKLSGENVELLLYAAKPQKLLRDGTQCL